MRVMFYLPVDNSVPINVSNLSGTKGWPISTCNAEGKYGLQI